MIRSNGGFDMKMNISASNFDLTPAIARHVQERLALALASTSRRIERVTVHLSDINGTRGGVDKRCRIVASVKAMEPVISTEVHQDLYAAIDAAAWRTKTTLRRQLNRRRTLARGDGARARLSLA
jgi:ribosomal subunit interface protein